MGHYKMIIVAASLSALAVGACSTSDNTGSSGAAQQSTDDGGVATATDAGAAPQCIAAQRFSLCSDGQSAAIAAAFNTAQLNAAQFIATTSQNTAVQAYAQEMVTQHTQEAAAFQTLLQAAGIAPVQNSIATSAAATAQLELQFLQTKSAATQTVSGTNQPTSDLDSAYMAQQILDHTTALATLDLILIPSAQNPQVQQAFVAARVQEANDLAQAIQIQQSLEGACGGTQSPATGADAGSGAAGQ